ncbi:MAG: formylglycine-generating enzyme family protein [Prevotella sp.]|nr:formylglycine-generating enzyme family protein [Prevotella sp.]
MKKSNFLLSIIFLSATAAFAQTSSCYELTRSKGIAAYNAGNYDRAIKYFETAAICEDLPNNNDLQTWKNKCKAAEKQKAENAAQAQREREAEQRQQLINLFPMVYVAGGTFTMGCTSKQRAFYQDDEKPAHRVRLSSYYIGKYEVTQAQWKAVMGNNPSKFKGDNLPVENVSWNDAQEFIRKLNAQTGKNYRLPTEAEWEFAARGGNKSKGYEYSGSNNAYDVAWFYDEQSHPVGTKAANELGIYDMSGNVWEWCSDLYGNYSGTAQSNPAGPASGSSRVPRGGGWYNSARSVRVSNRSGNSPDSRGNNLGFRLACSSK